MHALIVGPRGVGKSTLIRRVIADLDRSVFGFETKKETALEDETLGSPIYIYEAGLSHEQREDNLVGYCKNRRFATMKETFDRFAPTLRGPVPEGHIVVMDEIGFMESAAEEFCAAVLALLDGDAPVIAAVKDKDTPFLERVRSHPRCKCFFITPENRENLYREVSRFMLARRDREGEM